MGIADIISMLVKIYKILPLRMFPSDIYYINRKEIETMVAIYLLVIIVGAIVGGIIGVCTTTKIQNIMWEEQVDPAIRLIATKMEMEIDEKTNELLRERGI